MTTYTNIDFKKMTGREPETDDLDRLNCEEAGNPGHRQCGYCRVHDKPRFECGCLDWEDGWPRRKRVISRKSTAEKT